METIFSNPKEYSKKISGLKSSQKELKEEIKYYPKKATYRKSDIIELKEKAASQRDKQKEEEKKLGRLEKRRAEIAKKVKTALKKRVPHRTIIKKQDVRLTLPDIKRQNMWNDPNRFFKSEMEETKKSMFLR